MLFLNFVAMQKYENDKTVICTAEPLSVTKNNTLEDSIDKKKNDEREELLEEVANSIKDCAKEEALEIIKEENGFTAYSDKNSLFWTHTSGAEDFYESTSEDYYSKLMQGETGEQVYAPQAELQEHKAEADAEKSQYLNREAVVFGDQISMNGSPSLCEQTTFGANSVRTEREFMYKLLNKGWWHCMFNMQTVNPVF